MCKLEYSMSIARKSLCWLICGCKTTQCFFSLIQFNVVHVFIQIQPEYTRQLIMCITVYIQHVHWMSDVFEKEGQELSKHPLVKSTSMVQNWERMKKVQPLKIFSLLFPQMMPDLCPPVAAPLAAQVAGREPASPKTTWSSCGSPSRPTRTLASASGRACPRPQACRSHASRYTVLRCLLYNRTSGGWSEMKLI